MQKLAAESGAGNLRFFGKVFGTEKDYYVVEGALEGDDGGEEGEDEKPKDFEPRGTGVNKFVYWVTDSVLEKWTKLPDLYPSDIKAAREIKVSFTGDLERYIYTNPFFFGKEKNFLRAQIARISHSTSLVPRGLHKLVEDNDREIEEFQPEEGELQMPSTKDMAKADNWVHFVPNILKACTTVHAEPEMPEDAPEDLDPEELKK